MSQKAGKNSRKKMKKWEKIPIFKPFMCYNVAIMNSKIKARLKKFFSIEAILIYFGLASLSCSIYYKTRASVLFADYEREAINLVMLNNRISLGQVSPLEINEKCLLLADKYFPFTYFDFSLEDKLNEMLALLKEKVQSPVNQEKKYRLEQLILDFQDEISKKEISLYFGYDSLMYCSSLLLLISILCIIFKTVKQRNQIKTLQLRNDEQQKMSRNLHDGVAQDLAALKFYMQQDDKEKSDFYANQALNEIRYLISNFHLDLSEDFEKIIGQILKSFEANYKIKARLYVVSDHMSALSQNIQMEIIRILQESLSNIARHANATEVKVKFTEIGPDSKIIISDNGIGFDLEKVDELNKTDEKKHYGIRNIQERVKLMGGTVEFVNDGGTTIAITIKNIIR